MIGLNEVDGKSMALLLVSDDEGTATVTGTAHFDGERLSFEHGGEPSSFMLPVDTYDRIRAVPESEEVREILGGAEYSLTLSVRETAAEGAEGGERTGLAWPDE